MSDRPRDTAEQPRLIPTLKSDVGRVTADVMKRGVGHEIGSTFSGLEKFYLDAAAREQLAAMKPPKRILHRIGWLFKSLLLKLTPARRVLLALGLFLVIAGIERVDFQAVHVTFNFPILGDLLILLVLMLELKDKLLARDELEAGRRVQLALMPETRPIIPGWDVWLYTRPANDVGGDLVDHLRIDDDRHGVALGDVAGKALPAALLMVKLQATLRALIPQSASLSEFGAAVNRIIQRDGLPDRFATLVYLILSVDSDDVRVLNAGHMPPLVVRRGAVNEMERGSIALGLLPEARFGEQSISLADGDVLVVYSDGVTEAINAAGDFFDDARLRTVIRLASGQPAETIGTAVLAELERFVGDAPPHDDVSLVVVRRQGLPIAMPAVASPEHASA
jgi:serine phosphatase RsbU (regulator of sigma subunit)